MSTLSAAPKSAMCVASDLPQSDPQELHAHEGAVASIVEGPRGEDACVVGVVSSAPAMCMALYRRSTWQMSCAHRIRGPTRHSPSADAFTRRDLRPCALPHSGTRDPKCDETRVCTRLAVSRRNCCSEDDRHPPGPFQVRQTRFRFVGSVSTAAEAGAGHGRLVHAPVGQAFRSALRPSTQAGTVTVAASQHSMLVRDLLAFLWSPSRLGTGS
jgi:hypothetical protein